MLYCDLIFSLFGFNWDHQLFINTVAYKDYCDVVNDFNFSFCPSLIAEPVSALRAVRHSEK